MSSKDLARYSIFLAIAVIFSYIEHLVVLPFIFPGAKLGLANAVGLIILYIYGRDKYILFGLLRVLLSALLFTGFGSTFLISLGGNVLASLITILLVSNKNISIYGDARNIEIDKNLKNFKIIQFIPYNNVWDLDLKNKEKMSKIASFTYLKEVKGVQSNEKVHAFLIDFLKNEEERNDFLNKILEITYESS